MEFIIVESINYAWTESPVVETRVSDTTNGVQSSSVDAPTADEDPDDLSSHTHRLRLCKVILGVVSPPQVDLNGEPLRGYGFNVHTERYRVGHFVGSVDQDSAAAKASLRPGDRIIEVDGTNVEMVSHEELCEKISAARGQRRPWSGGDDGHLQLLVVDSLADEFFSKHGMKLSVDQPYVVRCGFDDVSLPQQLLQASGEFFFSQF